MRALIVGATGFLGSRLARYEIESGSELFGFGLESLFPAGCDGVVLDLSDHDTVGREVNRMRPEAVYHLAAAAYEPSTPADAAALYRANIANTVNLLNALKSIDFHGRFLLAGSCAVYGRPPAADGLTRESDPVAPVLEYGLTKALQEEIVAYYAQRYRYSAVIARLFNLTGPGEPPRLALAAFCKRAAEAAASGAGYFEVGNIDSVRDFLDVRDAASAFAALLRSDLTGPVNVSSGVPTRIEEVVELIRRLSGVSEVHQLPSIKRGVEVNRIFGDNSLLRTTGWTPRFELPESLGAIWQEAQARARRQ